MKGFTYYLSIAWCYCVITIMWCSFYAKTGYSTHQLLLQRRRANHRRKGGRLYVGR